MWFSILCCWWFTAYIFSFCGFWGFCVCNAFADSICYGIQYANIQSRILSWVWSVGVAAFCSSWGYASRLKEILYPGLYWIWTQNSKTGYGFPLLNFLKGSPSFLFSIFFLRRPWFPAIAAHTEFSRCLSETQQLMIRVEMKNRFDTNSAMQAKGWLKPKWHMEQSHCLQGNAGGCGPAGGDGWGQDSAWHGGGFAGLGMFVYFMGWKNLSTKHVCLIKLLNH